MSCIYYNKKNPLQPSPASCLYWKPPLRAPPLPSITLTPGLTRWAASLLSSPPWLCTIPTSLVLQTSGLSPSQFSLPAFHLYPQRKTALRAPQGALPHPDPHSGGDLPQTTHLRCVYAHLQLQPAAQADGISMPKAELHAQATLKFPSLFLYFPRHPLTPRSIQ